MADLNQTKITVEELLKQLTVQEKVSLLSGHKSWHTNKISRVNLPAIFITDGPHGLRKKREDSKSKGLGETEPSTAFPTAVTSGSTWNKQLIYKMGEALGKECNYYDVQVILGPAVNVKRNPLCGRNFEYFSEDPLITGLMGANLTLGIQSRGVGTSAKHYACNNNEKNRYFGDSIVDERAFREIYLKGFEHIVKKAKPASLMCAYNKVNGEYASENKQLLTDIPRGEWGYDGVIMSDWGAVNDRVKGLNAGLDLEMPGDIAHNRQVLFDAVQSGQISMQTLDKSVSRVLTMIINGINSRQHQENYLEQNSALSREIATEGAVLLKNENNLLPLGSSEKYLVIGEMFEKMRYQGAGSSLLRPHKLVAPMQAFDQNGVNYEYQKGYLASTFKSDQKLMENALQSAKNANVIIFFGGLTEDAESEGFDRENMHLPQNQMELISKLLSLGKKVVFVNYGGSPVELGEIQKVNAILNMYLPGQEGGNATYDLLFGKVSPSGRLCESWPISYSDVAFGGELAKTTNDLYKESIFVGYRYYSTFNQAVAYPFGYGLSYTTFEYSNMRLEAKHDAFEIRVLVKNTGKMAGAEVVELFVQAPQTQLIKSLRELRAFEKVFLQPNEQKEVVLTVAQDDMKYYVNGAWRLENGKYAFQICKNVNSVILSSEYEITNGEVLSTPEKIKQLYSSKQVLLNMTDTDFEQVVKRKITLNPVTRPYDLNTPMRDYKTAGGKFLFGLITFAFKCALKFNCIGKSTPDKQTKIKNTYFALKTVQSMSLRSISYSSEGMLSHRMALGLLDIVNNKPLKGIWKLITKEKCIKLPK